MSNGTWGANILLRINIMNWYLKFIMTIFILSFVAVLYGYHKVSETQKTIQLLKNKKAEVGVKPYFSMYQVKFFRIDSIHSYYGLGGKHETLIPINCGVKDLHLYGADITTKSIRHISKIDSLLWLNLSYRKISQAEVDILSGMRNLLELNLDNCQLTPSQLTKLKNALPYCVITHKEGR